MSRINVAPVRNPATISFVVLGLIVLVSLTACSERHIPLGEYRIEWDDHDPKLHGQVVAFNEPLIYDMFGPKDLKAEWEREFVEIGRYLHSARRDNFTLYEPEPVIDGMLFKIKGSSGLEMTGLYGTCMEIRVTF